MIKISLFGGEAPLFPSDNLPLPYAAFAKDCMFDAGTLRGFGASEPRGLFVDPSTTDAAIYRPEQQEYLLQFLQRTDVVQRAHASDSHKRVYWFSAAHPPRYADFSLATAGDKYPGGHYLLGLPAPSSVPVVTVIPAVDKDGKPVDHAGLGHLAIYRSFTYTYVSNFGEESGPYLPSDGSALPSVKMYEGDKIKMTGFVLPSGNYPLNAGKLRVYQTNTAGRFVRVATIDITSAEHEWVNTDPTGAELSTALTMPPVETMSGACLTSFGYMVGFSGHTVYCSDVYMYHSWPSTYARPCKHEILRVFPAPEGAYVMTSGGPYLLVGTDPSNTQLVEVQTDDVCLSAAAVCDLGGAVAYASQNGICLLTSQGVQRISDGIFNHLSWSGINAAALRFVRHVSQIVLIGPQSYVFSFDGDETKWVRSGINTNVAFSDDEEGHLIYSDAGVLAKFDSNPAQAGAYEWHSPRLDLASPQPLNCWRFKAEDYTDISFKVIVDGYVVQDWYKLPVLEDSDGYLYGRLPPYRQGRGIEVQFKGTSQLSSFLLAASFREMKQEQGV